MAPSLTARGRASPLVSPRLISRAKNHRLLSVRCRSSGSPPVVRAVVSAVTELLRVLSPSKKPRQAVESVNTELELPRSMEDVVAVLEADYARAYFLTGFEGRHKLCHSNMDAKVPLQHDDL
uniref:Uncharacterized protein n=1 Tax=Avena sativa TaxID=4498 RepID=A0ACD5UZC3_AVESA